MASALGAKAPQSPEWGPPAKLCCKLGERADCGYAGGGGDALLSFEDAAQRRPTGILTAVTQPCADHLQELIGDHGDEQMAVGADGLVVIDRA